SDVCSSDLDPTFVHEVLRRCMDNAIELVIPLGMAELYPMAAARPLFAEYDIALCVPEMAALAELMIVENPPREMPLSILQEGAAIAGNTPGMQQGALSGVFTPSDTDHDMALCCVTDEERLLTFADINHLKKAVVFGLEDVRIAKSRYLL